MFKAWLARLILSAAMAVPAAGSDASLAVASHDPPYTPRRPFSEIIHGVEISDPYRWLEDANLPEVKARAAAQNSFTDRALNGTVKALAQARLAEISSTDTYGLPVNRGGFYYYTHRNPHQQQPVIYRRRVDGGRNEVILDANRLSKGGDTGLLTMAVAPNGRYLVYGTIQGSDWETLRIRDTAAKQDLTETLLWTKSYGWQPILSWAPNSQRFFYIKYDAPQLDGGLPGEQPRLYEHALGTPQSADKLVFASDSRPELDIRPDISSDGRYLLVNLGEGYSKSEIWYRPIEGGVFKRLIGGFDANYWFVGNIGSVFYFQTDLDAPRWRLIAIDIDNPERANWRTIIPEQESVLQKAYFFNGRFVLSMLDNVRTRLMVHRLDGQVEQEIALPTYGTVADIYRDGISGTIDGPELFFGFTSYLQPKTIYRFDFKGPATTFLAPRKAFDADPYKIRQEFFSSKDGTLVPIFLVSRAGQKQDANARVYLSAYGGFGVPSPPEFSPVVVHWLEQGGIYAFANIRGGGEYGAPWHMSATREGRQKSFDDFIAAAEYLIASKYTRREKLAISGWSNGGLLTAAVLTQRPDLFGAAVVTAPVTDMIRYTRFTIGPTLIPELGDPDVAGDFAFLLAYSPYHRIKPGTVYPPTYINVGELDERTPAGPHSFKFAAALQAAQGGKAPIYLRVMPKAGHVIGLPPAILTEWWADEYAFLAQSLGE